MSDLISSRGPLSLKERAEVVKNVLQYNLELFNGGDEIWPDQCEYAASRLISVKVLVQDCFRLLDSGLRLPVCETPRQPLGSEYTVTFYYAYEQLDELQELVTAFQPICRTSSMRARKKRSEILSKLELFMLHSDDIIQNMTLLQEETLPARFLQSSLPLVLQERTEQQTCWPQKFTERAFSRICSGKPYPPYLMPVRDSYIEERDAPKPNPVEEDRATLTGDDNQKRENSLTDDALPLMNNFIDCQCSVAGRCMPWSSLESEQ